MLYLKSLDEPRTLGVGYGQTTKTEDAMLFSISCMVMALGLYTLAIWAERITHQLRAWMILVFSLAFACDITGTSLMSLMASQNASHEANMHMVCGISALLIMCLHLLWALFTIWKKGRAAKLFHSFSLYAWMIWLLAFITGIPK